MSNQVLEVIKERSSARAYSDRKLTKSELDIILETGLQTPTGMNRKEIHFSVLDGNHPILAELDEEKRKLCGQEKQPHNFYYEAPVLIVLSAENDFKWSKVDAGIAVQNMTLAAESLGLGILIIGCIYDAMRGGKKSISRRHFRFQRDIILRLPWQSAIRQITKRLTTMTMRRR